MAYLAVFEAVFMGSYEHDIARVVLDSVTLALGGGSMSPYLSHYNVIFWKKRPNLVEKGQKGAEIGPPSGKRGRIWPRNQ